MNHIEDVQGYLKGTYISRHLCGYMANVWEQTGNRSVAGPMEPESACHNTNEEGWGFSHVMPSCSSLFPSGAEFEYLKQTVPPTLEVSKALAEGGRGRNRRVVRKFLTLSHSRTCAPKVV